MKEKNKKIVLILILVLSIFLTAGIRHTSLVFAQNTNPNPAQNSNPNPGSPTTPATDCSQPQNANSPNCLYNPLPTGDFQTFILLVMKWVLGLIGIFAVLFIMIGGFRMIFAQGNEEAITTARKTITWAVIGLVVAILSYSMIAIVENLLQANIH